MTHPEANGGYVDEPEVAFYGFVVLSGDAAGVFEFVETTLDPVAKPVQPMIHTDAHLAGFAHRDLGQDIAFMHAFPNAISIMAPVCQKNFRLWQVIIHHQIKPQMVRCLPRRDVWSHGQPVRVDAEVDLGREPTS